MRPPILWITIAFAAGLWLGLEPVRGAWYVGLPLLVGAAVLARRAPVGAALGLAAAAGLLWGEAALARRAATCAGRWGRGKGEGGTGATVAVVIQLVDPVSDQGGITGGAVLAPACGGALDLRWPQGHAARGGTGWIAAGRYAGDAARGVLVARRVRLLEARARGRGALRDRLAARSAELFGTRAPLVDALVLARRAELDPALRERFARAGLAHLLAISGLHVGFLAGWLALFLKRAGVPPRWRLLGAAWLAFAYVWLLGFPAPATRAAVLLGLAGIARARERVVAPHATLALAALAVMLGDPWAARSVGAWLSVAAVAAVSWAGRALARAPVWLRAVGPAAAATIGTAPISAFAFGTVAPIGVLSNLVAVPLAGIAVPGLVFCLGLAPLWSGAARLLAAGAGLGLELIDLVAQAGAAVPGGHWVGPAGWSAAAAWLGVAAAAWWLWHSPRRPWLIAARSLFAVTIGLWAWAFNARSLDDCRCLTVHFLDVGQGDAIVLRTPAGRWIEVDGGPRTPQADAGRRVVVPFLRRQGVESLAVVVATHGDADHLGGLPAVIAAFPPRLVLEPGEPLGRPLYLEWLAAVEASGASWHPARAGDRITLDSVTLQVLSPDTAWMTAPVQVNEHGVVLLVTYGATRLVLMADAGLPVEARLAGTVGAVAVLKVGHHGSRSATGDAWLDELEPGLAVISVGARNNYGHPAPEVLERLARHGIPVLRTDRDGTITYRTDGHRAFTDIGHHD